MKACYPVYSLSAARSHESCVLGDDLDHIRRAMHGAGAAIGQALCNDFPMLASWPAEPRILVLAGKGLNAGDAFVAVSTLADTLRGLSVTIVQTADESDLHPLAAEALDALQSMMGDRVRMTTLDDFNDDPELDCEVVLDGLYGLGFSPPLRDPVRQLLKTVNEEGRYGLRAAIDIPSGIGEERDPDAFVADFTYIPGVAKEPCFAETNRAYTGRLRFLEIAPFKDVQPEDGVSRFLCAPGAYRSLNKLRPATSDKRDFGHGIVLGGSVRMPGAALMAGLAALKAGAGLVTGLTPATIAAHIASTVPEMMWHPLPLTPDGGLDVESVRIVSSISSRASSILVGPGMIMDRATVFSVCRIVRESQLALVLDASALTQDVVAAVLGRSNSAGPVILTPHRGEFARILGMKDDPMDADSLLAFSKKYRVVTILKGTPTLISDGERVITAPVGGPVLARGGSGDILSGILLALLGQNGADPLETAVNAVTWHGAAADSLARAEGEIAVRTTQLLDQLPLTLRS